VLPSNDEDGVAFAVERCILWPDAAVEAGDVKRA
jgi:hypothetical protein